MRNGPTLSRTTWTLWPIGKMRRIEMAILIKGMTPEQLMDVFSWARIGANNCMIGDGVTAIELPDPPNSDDLYIDLVKRGKWVLFDGRYYCSECDEDMDWKTCYCPNCGAKMDLEDKEDDT